MHPNLIQIITRLPKLSPESLDDFYNRFAWLNPYAKIIRHWSGNLVSEIVHSNNAMNIDELRDVARSNIERTHHTAYYPTAVVDYISLLTASTVDRLPANTIIPKCRHLLKEKDFFRATFWLGWFHYCTLLLETREETEAERLIVQWHGKFGGEHIWQFLPVAHFAHGLGITDERIGKAALIWASYLDRVRNGPDFASLMQGRSVAVVGNGPQGVGRGQGEIIDAHDVVIRFNKYRINHNTVRDYGRRTSICGTNPIFFDPPEDWKKLDALFFIDDYSRAFWINDAFLDRTLDYIRAGKIWFHFGDIVDAFSPLHQKITRETETVITVPTIGYRMAVAIKNLRPDFGLKHLYGFSCTSERPFTQEQGFHYDPDDTVKEQNLRFVKHKFEMERRALRWLFLEESANAVPDDSI
jgi:hypothetical protein